jgi:hypothetical protein
LFSAYPGKNGPLSALVSVQFRDGIASVEETWGKRGIVLLIGIEYQPFNILPVESRPANV